MEDCFCTLEVILKRISDAQPTSTNIVDILGSDVGKLLMCIKKLYFTEINSSFNFSAVTALKVRFTRIGSTLDDVIQRLHDCLYARVISSLHACMFLHCNTVCPCLLFSSSIQKRKSGSSTVYSLHFTLRRELRSPSNSRSRRR